MMRSKIFIRPDIHERFITLVARAEAKLKEEKKAVRRKLTVALAHETRAQASRSSVRRPSRVPLPNPDMDGGEEK